MSGSVEAKTAKILSKKIDKHKDSQMHKTAVQAQVICDSNVLEKSVRKADELFERRCAENIVKTEIAFRTAYECAHSSLSFREYPRLMAMQSMNGVNIGETLVSPNACSNVIKHVANDMT